MLYNRMKEKLKENLKILKEEKGLKIYPLKEVKSDNNKKTDYAKNLGSFWLEVKDRIEYNIDYLLRLVDNNDVVGFAIPTGYYNNIVVIDVDNKTSYNKDLSTEIIKKLQEQETLTIKTAGDGYHFIFKYTDIFKKGTTGILGHIDIRTSRNLIFNGIREDGEYTIYKNNNIKKLNDDIIKLIIDNIDIHKKQKDKNDINKSKNRKEVKRYDITDDDIKEILNGLPKDYLEDYKDWFKITAVLKNIDKKDIWEKWSQQSKKYNKRVNNKIWNDLEEVEGFNNSLSYLFWLYKYHNNNKKIRTIEKIYNDFIELNEKHLDKVININDKYLNIALLNDYQKLTIIKSSTNTGKTTLTIDYMKTQPDKKILSITHLKTIADDHHNRFNDNGLKIFHYENEKGLISNDWINTSGYLGGVIVINSILRLDLDDIKDYIIYLDEITAIIETLLNSPTIKERKEIINKFIDLLNGCYAIIATDATITDITKELLEGIIGEKSRFIINHHMNYTNKKAFFIDDYEEILELLKNDIKNNRTPIICSNSKTRIDKIEIEIMKIISDYNVKTQIKKYSSSEGDKIKDVNHEWEGKIKLYTPSIVQGVDYNPTREENVYSFVVGNTTLDPIQISQQIARDRKPLNTYINIEDCQNKSIFKGDVNKIKEYFKGVKEIYKKVNNKILNHYKNENNIELDKRIYNSFVDTKTTLKGVEKIDNPLTELFYKYKNNQDILRSAFKYNLKQILLNKGYEIVDRLFYDIKTDTRTKKQILEDKKTDKEKNKAIEDREKNKKFNEWINDKLADTNKYKITMDKRIDLLNISKTYHISTIEDFKETLINDKLFNLMFIIVYYLCRCNKYINKKTAVKNNNDFIENIYRDDDIKITTFKTLLIKYTDINPYYYTYNEEEYINQTLYITDEDFKNLQILTKTSKKKPSNMIDFLRILYRLGKDIYKGLISLRKNKSKKINGKVIQYQTLDFYYPLFHKYLEFIKKHFNNNDICPFIKTYIESNDFMNMKIENIEYDEIDNKSEISEISEISEKSEISKKSTITNNEIIISNPFKNINIEILKENILYLN